MIAYEDVLTRDARMYWHGGAALRIDPDTYEVSAWKMSIPDDGDVEAWAEEFSDSEVLLTKYLRRGQRGQHMSVSGHALLSYPEWTISRVPAEYVPVNNGDRLVRVALDGGRRAYKGMAEHAVRFLSLLDPSDQGRELLYPDVVSAVSSLRCSATFSELALGIAQVMSLGTPAAARRVLPQATAFARSKAAAREFFAGTARVFVPDFPVALVKHRSRQGEALVLFRGTYAGRLVTEAGELVFHGTARLPDRNVRAAYKRGLSILSKQLFADRVVWG